jgi:hypothetical protein
VSIFVDPARSETMIARILGVAVLMAFSAGTVMAASALALNPIDSVALQATVEELAKKLFHRLPSDADIRFPLDWSDQRRSFASA